MPCLARLPGDGSGVEVGTGVAAATGAGPRLDTAPVLLADVPATICDWFGVEPLAPGYGRSLWSLTSPPPGGAPSDRDTTFAFVVEDEPPRFRDRRWAVRAGDLKAVFNLDANTITVHDLAADPGETRDLAGEGSGASAAGGTAAGIADDDLAAELEARRRALETWRSASPTPRIPFAKRFSREELERLQSLGYLGGAP